MSTLPANTERALADMAETQGEIIGTIAAQFGAHPAGAARGLLQIDLVFRSMMAMLVCHWNSDHFGISAEREAAARKRTIVGLQRLRAVLRAMGRRLGVLP